MKDIARQFRSQTRGASGLSRHNDLASCQAWLMALREPHAKAQFVRGRVVGQLARHAAAGGRLDEESVAEVLAQIDNVSLFRGQRRRDLVEQAVRLTKLQPGNPPLSSIDALVQLADTGLCATAGSWIRRLRALSDAAARLREGEARAHVLERLMTRHNYSKSSAHELLAQAERLHRRDGPPGEPSPAGSIRVVTGE